MRKLRKMSQKPFPVWVFRLGSWRSALSADLLPGDIMSVVHGAGARGKAGAAVVAKPSAGARTGGAIAPAARTEGPDGSVPADALLLSGSCVVNEAMLTGESVPQVIGWV